MFLLIAFSIICGVVPDSAASDRPIIGVLLQEISEALDRLYPGKYDTYVPASYVKWVESGGARVVPIWTGRKKDYYKNLMLKLNGVLFPGGNVDKKEKGGYAEAANYIVDIAVEFNERKDFFPIFGIGLGMDHMIYLTNDGKDVTSDCHAQALSASLILGRNSTRSALYKSSSDHIKKLMTLHPIAVLNARRCYLKSSFEKSRLGELWIPFSYNYDSEKTMIVTSVEHRFLPFYGTLFHSEKIPFEWAGNSNLPHTLATVEVSQFFGNYFVNEARKSTHRFNSDQDIHDQLIQNYQPVFTAKNGSKLFETYLFSRKDEF